MMHPIANAACLFLLWMLACFGTELVYFNWDRIRAAMKGESR